MKTALLIAALAIAIAVPSHAHAGFKPLRIIGRDCRDTTNGAQPTSSQLACFEYITGVLNGIELGDIVGHMSPAERERFLDVPPRMDKRETSLFCVPDGTTFVTVIQKIAGVIAQMDKQYPELAEYPAQMAIYAAAAAKFPCRK